ncbi:DUF1634 domain-containing protein [Candidatus Bathyarchaeota archaeon]|nr:DUF1634 domain-containing protein [Candidatus Bathyarchaeota archaeon]
MRGKSLEKLELAISYILIFGVVSSVMIEAFGILIHYYAEGNLNITFEPKSVLKGANLFVFIGSTFQSILQGSSTSFNILSLGLALLIITPYVRVLASVIYFGMVRDIKYLFITLSVLVILTASLVAH